MQLIEIWETFLMQLDTDEGEAFVPPAGVVAPPSAEQTEAGEERPPTQDSHDSETQPRSEVEA